MPDDGTTQAEPDDEKRSARDRNKKGKGKDRKRQSSQERREKKNARQRKRLADPAYREKINAHKRKWYNTNPEQKEKHADRQRKRLADPEYREKINAQKRERYNANPEQQEKHADRRRKRLADPEYRERVNAKNRRYYARKKRERELGAAGVSRDAGTTAAAPAAGGYQSLKPEALACDVYEDYRQLAGARGERWPEIPPGLTVAMAGETFGRTDSPVILARIRAPEAGPSSASTPSFLADPSLDLQDRSVKQALRAAGVDGEAREQAERLQGEFLDAYVHASPDADEHAPALDAPDYHAAFAGADVNELARNVDMNALITSGLDDLGHWQYPVNPASASVSASRSPAGASSYGQGEVGALSREMAGMGLTAPAPAPVAVAQGRQAGSSVQYSQWSGVQGAAAYLSQQPQQSTSTSRSTDRHGNSSSRSSRTADPARHRQQSSTTEPRRKTRR